MSARRLALLGSKHGAWVSIRGMRNPHLRVNASRGTRVYVHVVQEDQSSAAFEFTGDGEYKLPEASFVRVSCDDCHKLMICDIVSRRAA